MTVDIKALRELLARATPGPWTCEIDCIDQDDGYVATFCDGATTTLWSAGTDIPLHFAPDGERWTEADSVERNRRYKAAHETQAFREAALIVAAVNALPQLLDEVERLQKERDLGDRLLSEATTEIARLRAALTENVPRNPSGYLVPQTVEHWYAVIKASGANIEPPGGKP